MIAVDKDSTVPAYIQIYEAMKADIIAGSYAVEERLPSVRDLAGELLVSRNTIDKAYQQLYAEGYIRSIDRSGYYIEPGVLEVLDFAVDRPLPEIDEPPRNPVFRGSHHYDFFYYDLPDELFPLQTWRKLAGEVLLSRDQVNAYTSVLGDIGLREQIARYLKKSRGVHCVAGQIALHSGIRDGLERLLKIFDASTDKIAFENPGYHGARTVFLNNKFTLVPLDVSSSASFFSDLEQSGARLVYVTPSHQFPTGKTMPYADRIKLIEWAERNKAFIIEDDYDSEYRYLERPIPSLQSLDPYGRVIYTGTFSKVLSPGLRASYWVYPPEVLSRYYEKMVTYWCAVSWFTQEMLKRFFEEGYWDRHVRKTVQHYKRSQRKLIESLNTHLGDRVHIAGEGAGLHLWIRVDDERSNQELAALAAAKEVGVYATQQYWLDPQEADPSTLLIGYSHIAYEKIEPGIKLLAEAWYG